MVQDVKVIEQPMYKVVKEFEIGKELSTCLQEMKIKRMGEH